MEDQSLSTTSSRSWFGGLKIWWGVSQFCAVNMGFPTMGASLLFIISLWKFKLHQHKETILLFPCRNIDWLYGKNTKIEIWAYKILPLLDMLFKSRKLVEMRNHFSTRFLYISSILKFSKSTIKSHLGSHYSRSKLDFKYSKNMNYHIHFFASRVRFIVTNWWCHHRASDLNFPTKNFSINKLFAIESNWNKMNH